MIVVLDGMDKMKNYPEEEVISSFVQQGIPSFI